MLASVMSTILSLLNLKVLTYLDAIVERLKQHYRLDLRWSHTSQADVNSDFLCEPIVVVIVRLDVNDAINTITVAQKLVQLVGGARVVRLFIGVDNHDHFVHVSNIWLLVVESLDDPKVCNNGIKESN